MYIYILSMYIYIYVLFLLERIGGTYAKGDEIDVKTVFKPLERLKKCGALKTGCIEQVNRCKICT